MIPEGKINHCGILETERIATQRNVLFIGNLLKKDVTNLINICEFRQINKYDRNRLNQNLILTATPSKHINTHLNTKDSFEININEKLISNYIEELRDITKEI